MAIEDQVVTLIGSRDEVDGAPIRLATKRDSVTGISTLVTQATGVTFDGTLDPTNLALEAGNLQTLAKCTAVTLGTVQKVAVAAAHAETANSIDSTLVHVVSTTNCHIKLADAPVATATDFYLPANTPMILVCAGTNKVSVIRDTADGSLYVTSIG